jgi:hypothetical protein
MILALCIIVLGVVGVAVVLVGYACCCVSSRAEEEARRMELERRNDGG